MDEKKESNEAKKERGTKRDERGLYAQFEPHFDRTLERLLELRESKNEAIALGATKEILARLVPARKALEIGGENGEPIRLIINAGNGFIPSTVSVNATPTASYSPGPTEIQSDNLAPESQEDNNSDNRVGEAEPTA